MKKLKLEELHVESFVTNATSRGRGTVRGREDTFAMDPFDQQFGADGAGEEEIAPTAAGSCTCASRITWLDPARCCEN